MRRAFASLPFLVLLALLPVTNAATVGPIFLVREANTFLDPNTNLVYDASSGHLELVGASALPIYVHVHIYVNGEPIAPMDTALVYTQGSDVPGGIDPIVLPQYSEGICLKDYCLRGAAYLTGSHVVSLAWNGVDLTGDMPVSGRETVSSGTPTIAVFAIDAPTAGHRGALDACIAVDGVSVTSVVPPLIGRGTCELRAYGSGGADYGPPTPVTDPSCDVYTSDYCRVMVREGGERCLTDIICRV